ncbi:hypothetical protein ACLKA7_012739 [Drosophila subpalustris]
MPFFAFLSVAIVLSRVALAAVNSTLDLAHCLPNGPVTCECPVIRMLILVSWLASWHATLTQTLATIVCLLFHCLSQTGRASSGQT